ncbi:hypothetical protein [Neptuniibacter sp. QD37_11]|uniref:hypothetical protein n=1 Tax=Neptuniibacter sp. QD37_11 TaxID=3398209 RepID=UPI0039F5F414
MRLRLMTLLTALCLLSGCMPTFTAKPSASNEPPSSPEEVVPEAWRIEWVQAEIISAYCWAWSADAINAELDGMEAYKACMDDAAKLARGETEPGHK